ncbi:MAG: hypothetical protein WC718_08670 [Phycisphaerales bacterium]|jgi:hypothetical protein
MAKAQTIKKAAAKAIGDVNRGATAVGKQFASGAKVVGVSVKESITGVPAGARNLKAAPGATIKAAAKGAGTAIKSNTVGLAKKVKKEGLGVGVVGAAGVVTGVGIITAATHKAAGVPVPRPAPAKATKLTDFERAAREVS